MVSHRTAIALFSAVGGRLTVYRVVVWAPGYTGRQALRELLRRPEFEVVGCLAYNPATAGTDVGALVGAEPTGTLVTCDPERIYRMPADVVVYTGRAMPDESRRHAEFDRLLRSGKNVVTSTAYHFPWQRGEDYVAPLEAACLDGGATLHGTGIHPGWFVERYALSLTGLCTRVDRLRVSEIVDLSHHAGEAIRGIGFGSPPERLGSRTRKMIISRYYFEVLAYAAYSLGVRLERMVADIRYLPGRRRLEVAGVTVEPGTVAAVEGTWTGYLDGEPYLEIHELWYLDPDLVEGTEITSPDIYQVQVRGLPVDLNTRLDMVVTEREDVYGRDAAQSGANLTTAVQVVQMIPDVVAAPPGIHLAPVPGRATHDLRDPLDPARRRPVPIPEEIR